MSTLPRHVTFETLSVRIGATAVILIAYAVVYVSLRPALGPMTSVLCLLPIAYLGWIWGARIGFLLAAAIVPTHSLLNWLLGVGYVPGIGNLPGIGVVLLAGPLAGWISTVLSRLRAQATGLRDREAGLRMIFNQIPAIFWTTDEHLNITSGMGDRSTANLLAEIPVDFVGHSLYDIFQTRDASYPPVTVHLNALQGKSGTYVRNRDGHQLECHVEPFRDNSGKVIGTIGIALDVSARQRSEEALRQTEERLLLLAEYDLLTHLPNRQRFQAELDAQLAECAAKGAGNGLSILFLDIDGFKYVNDSLGHQAGDDLLKSTAGLLRRALAGVPGSFLARLGGDEFAVMLPGHDAAAAARVAEQVVGAARKNIAVVRGQPVVANFSIGVAAYPVHGQTAETLLAHADLAMYQTKEHGRNGYSVYEPESGARTQSEQKLTWESRIRQALDQGRFVLHAQPIQTLAGGGLDHYELLLRMIGEDGELIPPGQFLDVAERFGLIRDIDRWVIANAIRLCASLRGIGQTPRLAVNLSGKAFTDPDLLPMILKELKQTGVDPKQLVFEITETALIVDMEQAGEWVRALQQVGCKFAIDDFGAGFSAFAHLRRLPVDYLKVDGSFIRNLPQDPVNQHLVRSMVEMARGLNMETVAEFVGDEATVRLIRACGIDYAQGFYVGKPAPVEHWWPGLSAVAPV